jgi:hypothetical protein
VINLENPNETFSLFIEKDKLAYDPDAELRKITKEKAKEWIIEDWFDLKDKKVPASERTSEILDGQYQWMNLSLDNRLFVFTTLKDLYLEEVPFVFQDKVLTYLVYQIEKTWNLQQRQNEGLA